MADDELYPCVGICMADPDSGYCLGCGRPPLAAPDIVAEAVVLNATQKPNDERPGQPGVTVRLPDSLLVLERGWLSSNNILFHEGDGATLVDSGYVSTPRRPSSSGRPRPRRPATRRA